MMANDAKVIIPLYIGFVLLYTSPSYYSIITSTKAYEFVDKSSTKRLI